MTKRKLFLCALILGAIAQFNSAPANAKVLPVPIVMQQTPEWCFAASASMIFEYFGFPNLNPAGDFQCGIVGAQGGVCAANCAALPCLGGGGTVPHVAAIMRTYATVAQQRTGFSDSSVRLGETGILTPEQIRGQIDNNGPVMAGISPSGVPFPPGLGVSEHAVVIVGYEGDENDFKVIINDPYPYPAPAPYVSAGGSERQLGQYEIAYSVFVNVFHYGNSLFFRNVVATPRPIATSQLNNFCAVIAQYFIDPPKAFLSQRGKQLSSQKWESNQTFPNSRCYIDWAGRTNARYSATCFYNQQASTQTTAAWHQTMAGNIDQCIALLPNRSEYARDQSQNSLDDGTKTTETSWENDGDDADYLIKITKFVSTDGSSFNTMTVSYMRHSN